MPCAYLIYIGRRLLFLMPQVFLISFITFALVRLLPGDPARFQLGPLAPEEAVEALRRKLHLDLSIPQQYVIWLQHVLPATLAALGRKALM